MARHRGPHRAQQAAHPHPRAPSPGRARWSSAAASRASRPRSTSRTAASRWSLVERSPSLWRPHGAALRDLPHPRLLAVHPQLPRMVEACLARATSRLETYAEVERIEGYVGNFEVTIRPQGPLRGRHEVQPAAAPAGRSAPSKKVPSKFDEGPGSPPRPIGHPPLPRPCPTSPSIDPKTCIKLHQGQVRSLLQGLRRQRHRFHPEGRAHHGQGGRHRGRHRLPDPGARTKFPAYADGDHPDVIHGPAVRAPGLRLRSPPGGEIRRPSDGKEPQTVVFLQCAGSRDPAHHKPYCSKICCMYTAKHAMLYKHKVHGGRAVVLCMDVRTPRQGVR